MNSYPDIKQTINGVEDLDLNKIYSYADYFSWQFEERFERRFSKTKPKLLTKKDYILCWKEKVSIIYLLNP